MKNLLAITLLLVSYALVSQETTGFEMVNFKDVKTMKPESLEGTWELLSFDYYKDDMIIDSARIQQGYRQVKMFQNGQVMWAREVPKTTAEEWYGFGQYEVLGDTLVEKLNFGSHALMKRFKPEHYFLLRTTGKNRFRQIRFDKNGNLVSSENYQRLTKSLDHSKD